MRQLFLMLALAGVLAPAALAVAEDAADGTLSVRNGRGIVQLDVQGVVIAQIDAGKIVVEDPNAEEGSVKDVRGHERSRALSDTKRRWSGGDMRVRLIGGDWKVTIAGRGIDISVVGRGTVTLDGRGDLPTVSRDGRYSLNDEPYQSLPNKATQFSLP